MKAKVYVALSADILHEGHINILKKASQLGKVIVGLLTDNAINEYKDLPILNFNQRKEILKNLKYIHQIVPQKTMSYITNLKRLKPDIVVHGDDWKQGILKKSRGEVVKFLKETKGKLVEIPYTKNISSSSIKNKIQLNTFNKKNNRVNLLKRLLETKKLIRVLETHSSLAGTIAETIKIQNNKKKASFDAFWSSSLTESLIRSKPDNQSVSLETRVSSLTDLMSCTSKPILFDADNGGNIEHLDYLIPSLERQGVSAIVIEDKVGIKINSLYQNQKGSKQDSIPFFKEKIQKISKIRKSKDFLIISRIESLILNKGLKDALKRAEEYSKSGADLILIHSKNDNAKEIFQFSKKFKKSKYFKPLVCVPSTYSKTYEKNLIKNNFSVVIYANHMLRASYMAMQKTALSILHNARSYEAEKNMTSVKDILNVKPK